jgi:hypothetical protein
MYVLNLMEMGDYLYSTTTNQQSKLNVVDVAVMYGQNGQFDLPTSIC